MQDEVNRATKLAEQAMTLQEEAAQQVTLLTSERDRLYAQLESYKDGSGDTIIKWPLGCEDLHVHPKNLRTYGVKVQDHIKERFKFNGQIAVGGTARCIEDGKTYILDGTSRNYMCNDPELRQAYKENTGNEITCFLAKDWGDLSMADIERMIDDANAKRKEEVWMVLVQAADARDGISRRLNGKMVNSLKQYADSFMGSVMDKGERTDGVLGNLFFGGQSYATVGYAMKIFDHVMSLELQDEWMNHKYIRALGDNPNKLKNPKKIWALICGKGPELSLEKKQKELVLDIPEQEAIGVAQDTGIMKKAFSDQVKMGALDEIGDVHEVRCIIRRLDGAIKDLTEKRNLVWSKLMTMVEVEEPVE